MTEPGTGTQPQNNPQEPQNNGTPAGAGPTMPQNQQPQNPAPPTQEPQNNQGEQGDQEPEYNPFGTSEEPTPPEPKQAKKNDDEYGFDEDDESKDQRYTQLENQQRQQQQQIKAFETRVKVDDFLSAEPNRHLQQYRQEIMSVATNPKAQNMTVEGIVALALGPERLMRIGANMGNQANTQAQRSSMGASGGAQQRASGSNSGPDYWGMTPEQFDQERRSALVPREIRQQ